MSGPWQDLRGPLPERPGLVVLQPVDPLTVRFAHSRVRPVFSGCGSRLEDTLSALASGRMPLAALPPIAVLAFPGNFLVSLNNRRLWVLQELARVAPGALLAGGLAPARLRAGTRKEALRYTTAKCATHATLMRTTPHGGSGSGSDVEAGQVSASDGEDSAPNAGAGAAAQRPPSRIAPPVPPAPSSDACARGKKQRKSRRGRRGHGSSSEDDDPPDIGARIAR